MFRNRRFDISSLLRIRRLEIFIKIKTRPARIQYPIAIGFYNDLLLAYVISKDTIMSC